jgi:hypothetical protein
MEAPGLDTSFINGTEFAPQQIRRYVDYCYGSSGVNWTEAINGVDIKYVRRFDYWRGPNTDGLTLPLIIWSHPNGSTETIGVDSDLEERLVKRALGRGFALMSIQFRHPTSSQKRYTIPLPGKSPPDADAKPATDIATAVQFARQNTRQLQIDPANIFLVGQSRGSLAVLTALIKDQKKPVPGTGDEALIVKSSKPRAVFAIQAQVTYEHNQLRDTFIKEKASTQVTQAILANGKKLQFPDCVLVDRFSYWCHYDKSDQKINNVINTPLSALSALTDTQINNDGVPIWLRYDRSPVLSGNTISPIGLYVNNEGEYQTAIDIDNNTNCYESASATCTDVHHPNFGRKLVDAYKSIAPTIPKTYIFAQYGNALYSVVGKASRDAVGQTFFENYYCFFMTYRTADGIDHQVITDPGNALRVAGVDAWNMQFSADDPRRVSPDKCKLSETDVWPPQP